MVCFTEALEVDNLSLAQEVNGVVHIGIIAEPQDVIIGHPGLLLRSQILCQVRDHIALDTDACRVPGRTGGSCRIDAGCVVQEIRGKAALLNLFLCEIPSQLVYDGSDHLQVPQFLGTC